MAGWVRCTDKVRGQVFLNMATAASLFWNEQMKCTVVTFPADEEPWEIKERPEMLLSAEFEKAS